jgi:hypothetical protein
MHDEFVSEAVKCRVQAEEFAGKPEQPFLLRLASAFEELAQIERGGPRTLRRVVSAPAQPPRI